VAQIEVTFFDGSGNRLTNPKRDVLLSVRDGRQTSFHREFVTGPSVTIRTDFHDSPQDDHVVLASMKGHRDAGFMPVTVTATGSTPVNLMLLPRRPAFAFASVAAVQAQHPALGRLLARSFGNGAAAQFETLQAGPTRAPLACLLNIVEALDVLALQHQKHGSLVDYIDRLDLSPALAWLRQDRFFAWVDETIEDAITTSGLFAKAPDGLHPGARISYKQFGFGEANVQITLHPDSGGEVGGVKLIKAEFDIDYFRDSAAHLLLEVFPNHLKRFVFGNGSSESLTDPAVAYGLRWMAARQPNAPTQTRPFAPAFGIQPAA
jgi:hypothetical protein